MESSVLEAPLPMVGGGNGGTPKCQRASLGELGNGLNGNCEFRGKKKIFFCSDFQYYIVYKIKDKLQKIHIISVAELAMS